MKYTYSDWHDKSGTIPVTWQVDDYESLPWYRYPDKDKGFTTKSNNYDIYGERLGCYIPKFEEAGKGIFVPKNVEERLMKKLKGL